MSSIVSTSTSAFFERATQGIGALRKRAEELQDQLGKGERLTRSSDDPVAASRLRVLARADSLSQIDQTNANRATSDLTLADSAMSSLTNYIARVKEIALTAANGTLSPAQRSSLSTELTQIHGNILAVANSRDSGGHALFGGEASGEAYALDGSGNAVYVGTASSGDLPIADGQTVSRGVTGPEFLNFTVGGTPTDLMAVVKGLADALQGGSADPQADARNSLTALDTGLETVTTAQTLVGARLSWIDLTAERRTELGELRAGEQETIGSPDIGATIAEMQQVMLVLDASQASFSKLANLSLFNRLG